jgi:hypothetical protein
LTIAHVLGHMQEPLMININANTFMATQSRILEAHSLRQQTGVTAAPLHSAPNDTQRFGPTPSRGLNIAYHAPVVAKPGTHHSGTTPVAWYGRMHVNKGSATTSAPVSTTSKPRVAQPSMEKQRRGTLDPNVRNFSQAVGADRITNFLGYQTNTRRALQDNVQRTYERYEAAGGAAPQGRDLDAALIRFHEFNGTEAPTPGQYTPAVEVPRALNPYPPNSRFRQMGTR